MKKIIIAFTIASSFSVMARAETYKNSTGCVVDKQNFNRVEDYNVYKGNLQDGIMYINDGSYAAFQYCNNYKNNKFTIVNKPWGTKITLTCRNQQNGWALTRGRIELDLVNGNLKNISIYGEAKKPNDIWREVEKIECLGLELQ